MKKSHHIYMNDDIWRMIRRECFERNISVGEFLVEVYLYYTKQRENNVSTETL